MKRIYKPGLLMVILLLVLSVVTACTGGGGDVVSQQLVKVERGDLTIEVTGSGKIKATRETRLTFGSAGKVDEILVKEGDEVKAGDVMARLDTSTLELALAQSKVALTQAETALTQARLAQRTAEYNLKNTRGTEGALKLALLNTQISLDTAEKNLDAGITAADYAAARAQLNRAEAWYEYVRDSMSKATGDQDVWILALETAQEKLDTARAQYDNLLAGYDSTEVAIRKKQVAAAEMSVAQAQKNLDELADNIALGELQVASASQSIVQAQQSVELARLSLGEAQKQLDEATIMATFDGIVAQVLVKEGDNIPSPSMAPTMVVHLIDPTRMELVVEVDEIDIPRVKLSQEAIISVDSLPGAEFEGIITAVNPVPKEEGGVVLYEVRLSLDAPRDSGIRVGMSASAKIVLEKLSNVLLVPSRAVYKDSQGQPSVKVMVNGQTQERAVTGGLDDGFRTEIVSGLSEGETVVVEVKVRSTSASIF